MRYLLFIIDFYEPAGGLKDIEYFSDSFDKLYTKVQELKLIESEIRNWYILDIDNKRILKDGSWKQFNATYLEFQCATEL